MAQNIGAHRKSVVIWRYLSDRVRFDKYGVGNVHWQFQLDGRTGGMKWIRSFRYHLGEWRLRLRNIYRLVWVSLCRVRVGCFGAAMNGDRKFGLFDIKEVDFEVRLDYPIVASRFRN